MLCTYFENFTFETTLFSKIFEDFYSTDRKAQKLFKGLVVGFGLKECLVECATLCGDNEVILMIIDH